MTEHYIENEAYTATVNAVAERWNLNNDDVKIALGECGNVWPCSIRTKCKQPLLFTCIHTD